MELMGMKTSIVPPNPGNLSAFGLLAVDWRTDHIVTKVMHEDAIDFAAVAAIYTSLEADGTATLEKDGIPPAKIALMREADVRYAGQSMEVRVAAPAGAIDAPFVAGLVDAFHAAHLKNLRLQLCRPAEGGTGEFLRLRLRHDRSAAHSRTRRIRRGAEADEAAGLFRRQIPRHAGVSPAPRCRPASRSTARRSSRSSARRPWCFPGQQLMSIRTAF